MYNNIEKDFNFAVKGITYVIIGIFIFVCVISLLEESALGFFIGIIGVIFAYYSGLILCGFGKIIENTDKTSRNIELLLKEIQNNKTAK